MQLDENHNVTSIRLYNEKQQTTLNFARQAQRVVGGKVGCVQAYFPKVFFVFSMANIAEDNRELKYSISKCGLVPP